MTQSTLLPIQIMFLGVLPLVDLLLIWFFWRRYRRFVETVRSHDESRLIEGYRTRGIDIMTLPMSASSDNSSFTTDPAAHHFLAQRKYEAAFDELTKHPARQPKTYFEQNVTTADLEQYIRHAAEQVAAPTPEEKKPMEIGGILGNYKGQEITERYQAAQQHELLKVFVATKGFVAPASDLVDYERVAKLASELLPEEAHEAVLAPGVSQYIAWFERVSSPTSRPSTRLIGFTVAHSMMIIVCVTFGILITIPATAEQIFGIPK